MAKLAPRSKFAEKSEICAYIFLNNFDVPNIFLGQVHLFWKLWMPAN
jgi:hypothetical protein